MSLIQPYFIGECDRCKKQMVTCNKSQETALQHLYGNNWWTTKFICGNATSVEWLLCGDCKTEVVRTIHNHHHEVADDD